MVVALRRRRAARCSPSSVGLGALFGFMTACTALGLSAPTVVLDQLADELGVEPRVTVWVLAAFSLALAVSTPLLGRFADIHGTRSMLTIGAALSILGAAIALLDLGFSGLVAARILLGSGGAGLSLGAFAVLASRLDGPDRARALGVLTAESSLALGFGPLLGALISDAFGWRAVLALPVLAVLALPVALRNLPGRAATRGRLDLRGGFWVVVAAGTSTALLQARATQLSSALVVVLVLAGVTGTIASVRHARAHPDGFLPADVTSRRPFVWLCSSAGALMGGYLGMLFMAPLLLSSEHRWGHVQIGAVLAPAAVVAAVAAGQAGRLAARHPTHLLLVATGVVSAAGIVIGAAGHKQSVCVVIGVSGAICGFAVAQVAVIDSVVRLVPANARGVALGVFNLFFVTGGAIGVASAGGLADAFSLPLATVALASWPLFGIVFAAMGRTASE